ncbi:hypothetical protein ZWY2020_050999 [Hordeum vulgare]|nr:hypothetical protein ZWY2020_050999 [Hordeum vulgare]
MREEAEAEDAARRVRKEEEEERLRRQKVEEEAAAAARRVRDATDMKGSSSSRAPFRYNERPRGGPRVVAVAHPPPPPPRGEGSAVDSGGAAGGSRGRKGLGRDAADGTLGGGGGGRALDEWKGKASAGLIAGPAGPATGGKPEEKSKGETSGCQASSVLPGELAEADAAPYRGSVRPKYKHKGKKGLDGRSTETAMSSSLVEAVKASPMRVVDSENNGKTVDSENNGETGSNNKSTGKASASPPGEAAEASPLQGVKCDNKWKKKNKPPGGRQAGAAPSSDWPNGRRGQPRPSAEGSRGRRNGDVQGAVWEAKSDGLGGKQPEVEGKVYSHPPTEAAATEGGAVVKE